ncbi:MAG: 50S ribosomal protein L11 methyltransferase [Anaerolineales bacterium]|nr:50S ribosomal protein L11 methyltransferase [Anaerolineales bacterium]
MSFWIPVLVIVLVGWMAYTVMSTLWVSAHGAPWVPTKRRTVRRLLEMAEVHPGETVYDLGSGDGRVLFAAVRMFGARAVGIELDPLRVWWTRGVAGLLGIRNCVEVRQGDFFTQDLRDADVVVCYLLTSTNRRLADKLREELHPGARVVSNAFPFPDWELVAEDLEHRVYLYRI